MVVNGKSLCAKDMSPQVWWELEVCEVVCYFSQPGVHDMGGVIAGLPPLNRAEHNWQYWEKQIDALAYLLWGSKKMSGIVSFATLLSLNRRTVQKSN